MSTGALGGRPPWFLLALYAVSQANIARLLWPLGTDVIQLQTTTDAVVIRQVVSGWTPAQRQQYRRHLTPDTLHPLLYGALLVAGGRAVSTFSDPTWVRRTLVAAPVAAAVCDLVENAFHARFCARPMAITTRAATLSSIATRIKWVLALGSVSWIVFRARRQQRAGQEPTGFPPSR